MPNGYQGPKAEWDRMEKPLITIDSDLARFASSKSLEIEKNYHAWPSRSLKWRNDASRLIQIYLEDEKDPTFNVWICACEDRENGRYGKDRMIMRNVKISVIQKDIKKLLADCVDEVNSWKPNDFIKGIKGNKSG